MTDRSPNTRRFSGRYSAGQNAGPDSADPHHSTHHSAHSSGQRAEGAPFWGLPDPDTQAEFYADVAGKRAIAWVIDMALVFAIVLALSVLTVGIGFFFFGFLFLAVGFIYRTVTLANGSATLGMRMVAIEVRNAQGERLDLGAAALHTLGYHLSMAFVFPQLVSIVLMLTTARGQGLSDHILGTAAINRAARP